MTQEQSTAVAKFEKPRLPYHPVIEERFGVTAAEWKALTEAVFPNAKTSDSVVMALSYCRARKLDPFKRVVHIVPVYDGAQKKMVETVWPGIAELRTTAFRTGQYAGRDPAEYGKSVTEKIGSMEITYPEWCQVTVYRLLGGQRVPFPGPRVYWKETYATVKRDDPTPNSMWRKRPNGQLDKCAEAAALRGAFPEEIGADYTAEEMEGQTLVAGADGDYAPQQPAPPRPQRKDVDPAAAGHVDPAEQFKEHMSDAVTTDGEVIEDETESEETQEPANASKAEDATTPTEADSVDADSATEDQTTSAAPGPSAELQDLPKLGPAPDKKMLQEWGGVLLGNAPRMTPDQIAALRDDYANRLEALEKVDAKLYGEIDLALENRLAA